jgi:hypothetical protein
MNNDQEKDSEKVLRRLADLIAKGQAGGADREGLESEIRDAGIDPKAYLSTFQKTVDDKIVAHRAAIRSSRLRAESKLATLLEKVKERIARLTPDEEKAWLARLEPRLSGAYFRNFKSASPADRLTMLEDAELLAKLEEIMREEDSKE